MGIESHMVPRPETVIGGPKQAKNQILKNFSLPPGTIWWGSHMGPAPGVGISRPPLPQNPLDRRPAGLGVRMLKILAPGKGLGPPGPPGL